MDSINIINPKFNKRRLQKITTLFRFIELFFFLVLVSRFSLQIPFNFNLSGEFFRRISAAVFSPRFVFMLGNVIVLTLFLKSGCYGNKSSVDFCEEYVQSSVTEPRRREKVKGIKVESDYCRERKFRRSRSENLGKQGGVKQSGKLSRSLAERCRKTAPAVSSCAAEEMTGEEFRRAVEAFIERQQKFLRKKSFQAEFDTELKKSPVFIICGHIFHEDWINRSEILREGWSFLQSVANVLGNAKI